MYNLRVLLIALCFVIQLTNNAISEDLLGVAAKRVEIESKIVQPVNKPVERTEGIRRIVGILPDQFIEQARRHNVDISDLVHDGNRLDLVQVGSRLVSRRSYQKSCINNLVHDYRLPYANPFLNELHIWGYEPKKDLGTANFYEKLWDRVSGRSHVGTTR